MTSVFIAYAAHPPMRAEVMRATASRLSDSGVAATTWEDLRNEGQALIPLICDQIDRSECVVAEVSDLNNNVLFEAGFALARGKELWLAVDKSEAESMRNWRDLGILATVGRVDYEGNSDSLANQWLSYYTGSENSLIETLLINGKPREGDAIFAPSTPVKFEAASTLEKHLDRQGHIRVLGATDDLGLAPLDFFVKEIYRSSGCIFHLMPERKVRSREHNARASFLAGIAKGFDLPVLMLAEDGESVALDYHDLTFKYSGSAQAISKVDSWITELPHAPGSTRRPGRLALNIELPIRSFGEYVAEYERAELQSYFITTSEFQSVVSGTTKIFVGRKGTGKTATMSQAVEDLREDRRVLVVPIKPSAYEISGLAKALHDLKSHGSSDYLVISLWTFLLYTEIALRAVSFARERSKYGGLSDEFNHLEHELQELGISPEEDMATRLENTLHLLNREARRDGENPAEFIARNLKLNRVQRLKAPINHVLQDYERVAVLIDNLDKAWERGADYETLSRFILGLLVTIGHIEKDFEKSQHGEGFVHVTLTAFLRSDIFDSISRFAREPDKISVRTVQWGDEVLLARVLEERYAANKTARKGVEAYDMWAEIFDPEVRGLRTRDYFMWRVLPRPRDVIYFANEALTTAINRKHSKITASDILFAETQYSRFAVEALLVEAAAEEFDLESALFEFAGLNATIASSDLEMLLAKHENSSGLVQWLVQSSFLGIETKPGKFLHVEGKTAAERSFRVAARLSESTGNSVKYRVHPAMRSYLEVSDDDLHDDGVEDMTLRGDRAM